MIVHMGSTLRIISIIDKTILNTKYAKTDGTKTGVKRSQESKTFRYNCTWRKALWAKNLVLSSGVLESHNSHIFIPLFLNTFPTIFCK